jgi:predicted dehydrogenase
MHDEDRRDVLRMIGASAAVTMAGSAGAQGRKVGFAVLGLGYYATQQIMPNFKDCDQARLVALISGTPEKLERFGSQYSIPASHRYSYADFARVRDNSDIDVVYVVTPPALHPEWVIKAAQAGKHVLSEKPMAVSSAECRRMIAACKKANRLLMVGYRCHYEPYNRLAIELARSGHVGRTRQITAEHGFSIAPNQWRLDRKLAGGGSMMDIGIYSLNAARYLTGEEPVEVSAIESTDRSDPRFSSVEDRVDFLLRFPSGIVATCVSSYSSSHNTYRVTGTDGWIDMDPATSYQGQAMRVRKGDKTEERKPPSGKNQFAAQLDHFADCVLNGKTPDTPGEEGLRDLLIIEAIYRSARERRHVAIERV